MNLFLIRFENELQPQLMKKLGILLLLISAFSSLNAQDSLELLKLQQEISLLDSTVQALTDQLEQSKAALQTVEHSGKITVNSGDEKTLVSIALPYAIAVFLGLLSLFGTLYIGRTQRESSKKQIDRQLAANQQALTMQIESANHVADLTFRQNVLSGNRQAWINELRETISELIGLCDMLSLFKKAGDFGHIQSISKYVAKAELMLNPAPDQNGDLIKALKKLNAMLLLIKASEKTYGDILPLIEEVKELTQTTLKTEWIRVKDGN